MRILASLAAVSIVAGATAQLDTSRVVATVNGEPIKAGEYYKRMEFLSGVGKRVGDNLIEAPPGFLTILQLIGERLVLQLAKEKGVMPTEAELQAERKLRLEGNPKLLQEWSSTGGTDADLMQAIKYELARFKLQTAGITITDQEVEKFYNDNKEMFTKPRGYKLYVIVVENDAAAKTVDQALGSKGFSAVAKEHSVDATRALGGAMGTVQINFVPKNVQDAIKETKIGKSTPWLNVNGKKARYFVEDIVPEKVHPLDAKTKLATRRQLMIDRGRKRNNLTRDIENMRARAKVNITQKEFMELYKQFISTPIASND